MRITASALTDISDRRARIAGYTDDGDLEALRNGFAFAHAVATVGGGAGANVCVGLTAQNATTRRLVIHAFTYFLGVATALEVDEVLDTVHPAGVGIVALSATNNRQVASATAPQAREINSQGSGALNGTARIITRVDQGSNAGRGPQFRTRIIIPPGGQNCYYLRAVNLGAVAMVGSFMWYEELV